MHKGIFSYQAGVFVILSLTAVLMAQDLPFPGPPHHIGDLPGENVITFGIILPLSNPAANGLCGAPNIRGLTTMEAVAWAISNARVIHSASSLKIGKHCQLYTAMCGRGSATF